MNEGGEFTLTFTGCGVYLFLAGIALSVASGIYTIIQLLSGGGCG